MNDRILTVVVGVLGGTLLCGCPNPNIYGTPRTVPAGKIAHSVAVEGLSMSGKTKELRNDGTVQETKQSFTLPTLPTYQIRVGLGDRVDIGGRVANLSSFGADVKWNFLKSKSFDMAVSPGAQFIYFSSTTTANQATSSSSTFIGYLHLPLLLGVNVGESVTFVGTPGIVYAGTSTDTQSSGREGIISNGGVLARFGLGVNLRINKEFAIHPEVTGMRAFNDTEGLIVLLGLGFNFGKLPGYGPGSEDDVPEEEADKKKEPSPAPATSTPTTPTTPTSTETPPPTTPPAQ